MQTPGYLPPHLQIDPEKSFTTQKCEDASVALPGRLRVAAQSLAHGCCGVGVCVGVRDESGGGARPASQK